MKRTLNVDEAAARLDVTRRTVYNMTHDGRLTAEHGDLGLRVLTASVEALQERQQVEREGRVSNVTT